MAVCVNCARELRPDWKFCVYCGTPTGVTSARAPEVSAATRAIPIIVLPEPAPEPVAEAVPVAAAPAPALAAPAATAAPATPAPATPAPATPASHAPTLVLAPPEPAAPAPVISVRTRSHERAPRRRLNALAVVALVLGCLASPLAALFGHLALAQLTAANERGRRAAIVAIALGYGWLATIVVMAVVYVAGHA